MQENGVFLSDDILPDKIKRGKTALSDLSSMLSIHLETGGTKVLQKVLQKYFSFSYVILLIYINKLIY